MQVIGEPATRGRERETERETERERERICTKIKVIGKVRNLNFY